MRKTYEEMKFFKMELQNREENFNGLFGNHPRVGTLNPLGPKLGPVSSISARDLGASKELTQATHAGRGAISQVAQLGVGPTNPAAAAGAPNGGGPVAGRRRSVGARINQAGSAPAGANGAAVGSNSGGLGVGAEMTDPTASRRPRHV